MYSAFIRTTIALTAFAPVLLISWIIRVLTYNEKLNFYLEVDSLASFVNGTTIFFTIHWELFLFLAVIILTKLFMNGAINRLPSHAINIKAIKPADINFVTVLISYVLPWGKLLFKDVSDLYYLLVFLLVCLAYAFISKGSYHFNINMRLFFGYRHYEIQNKDEVTFLMLSKKKLINRADITQYVLLTDHMIINVS